MTSKSTVHSSPCSSKSGRLSTTSAGTFSPEMSPIEVIFPHDAWGLEIPQKLPKRILWKEAKQRNPPNIKRYSSTWKPQNHPFDTPKLCIFQTSNLHVSLPNVSFHGCTTPRGYWKNPCLFEVLLSLNQLLCLTERKWKKQQEWKKEERRGLERRRNEERNRQKQKGKGKELKRKERKASAFKQKQPNFCPIQKNLLDNTKQKCWSKQNLPKNTNVWG